VSAPVIAGYLDDLFVSPELRGTGAVDALFAEINRIAIEATGPSCAGRRRTTTTARAVARHQLASRTTWITYDMTPVAAGLARREADARELGVAGEQGVGERAALAGIERRRGLARRLVEPRTQIG
jgi:hypothetical protein